MDLVREEGVTVSLVGVKAVGVEFSTVEVQGREEGTVDLPGWSGVLG